MVVSAVALAWWLVSLPVSLPAVAHPAAAPVSEPSTAAPSSTDTTDDANEPPVRADGDADSAVDDPGDQRVVVRRGLSPEIVRTAKGLLDLPLGAERFISIAGRRYVFVLEWHYHPRGFVGAPTGWHKGVTVYELVRGDPASP
jgi:hypothetical protein